MANSPLKKKYTIWQTLRDGGFYRVFECPECKHLWGYEKKLTWKHNRVEKFIVGLYEGNHCFGNREFESMAEAYHFWVKTYAK